MESKRRCTLKTSETSDPYEHINEHERRLPNDSLKKLRRDCGKVKEFVDRLTVALELRGGTVEHLFGTLSGKNTIDALEIDYIADFLMGCGRVVRVDPLEIVTNTGGSDVVRSIAVAGIKEEYLPVHLLINNPGFCFPRTRIAIVERLTDQTKLKEIALKGGRNDGALAANKLASFDDLYDVAMGASYQSTALVAVERLSEEYLCRLAECCMNEMIQVVAIGKITDRRKLLSLTTKWPWLGNHKIAGLNAINARLKEIEVANHQ